MKEEQSHISKSLISYKSTITFIFIISKQISIVYCQLQLMQPLTQNKENKLSKLTAETEPIKTRRKRREKKKTIKTKKLPFIVTKARHG